MSCKEIKAMGAYDTWHYICFCTVDITLYFQIEYEPKTSILFYFSYNIYNQKYDPEYGHVLPSVKLLFHSSKNPSHY